jgi:hypothetical protein
VTVGFIGGGNWSARRKPATCCKSLTNFIIHAQCINFFDILKNYLIHITMSSWSWSYGCWIYNYLCNQCLSPLTLWVRTPFMQGELDITLCDKVCQWIVAGQWFSLSYLVSSTNKTDRHNITVFYSLWLHSIRTRTQDIQYLTWAL